MPNLPADERTLRNIALAHLPFLWSTAPQETRERILRSLVELRQTCRPELAAALDQFADVAKVDLRPPREPVFPPEVVGGLLGKFELKRETNPTPVGVLEPAR